MGSTLQEDSVECLRLTPRSCPVLVLHEGDNTTFSLKALRSGAIQSQYRILGLFVKPRDGPQPAGPRPQGRRALPSDHPFPPPSQERSGVRGEEVLPSLYKIDSAILLKGRDI